MPEGLKIQIGAEIGGAVAGIKKVDSELKILGVGADKVGLQFKNLTQKVEFFGGGVKKLSVPVLGAASAIGKAETQLRKLSPASNQATQSMINLGRVVQDAPFGFLGIANNLNPLLESFQRLKASTGSTGSALKALGSSLIGVGGLGFALSIVSSLLIVFGDKIFGASKSMSFGSIEAEKFKNQLKGISDALDDMKSGFDFLQKIAVLDFKIARGEGPDADIFGFKKQIIDNQSAIRIFDNQIDIVTKQSEKFRKDIEGIKISGPGGIANIPFDAFINQFGGLAKVPQAIIDKLGTIEKRNVENLIASEKQIEDILDKRKDALRENEVAEKQIGLTRANAQRELSKKEQEEYKKALEALRKFQEERARLFELTAFDPVKHIDTKDTLAEYLVKEIAKEEAKSRGKPLKISFVLQPLGAAAKEILKDIKLLQSEMDSVFSSVGITFSNPELSEPQLALLNIQKQGVLAAQTIHGTLMPAFEGLFDAILAGENPLKAFFQGLGNAVKQLIQKLISAAIMAAALAAIFPGGLGSGATAIKGFSSIFRNLLGFQHGGLVFGPTLAMIGEGGGTSSSNPEVVAPLDRLKNLLGGFQAAPARERLITEVSGDNLRIILARNERKQRRGT